MEPSSPRSGTRPPQDGREFDAHRYYFGILIAGFLNASVGARYGWRAMFVIGGLPALQVIFIRKGVQEPKRWKPAASTVRAMAMLFTKEYRKRVILNSLYILVSIIGLWAGSVYTPSALIFLANKEGLDAAEPARIASFGTILLSVGTIVGCFAVPPLAEHFGRRWTQAFLYTLMLCSIALGFGYAFYLKDHALAWLLVLLFAMGFGGANHTMYSLWCLSSIALNAGPARLDSQHRLADLLARYLRFWSVRACRTTGR